MAFDLAAGKLCERKLCFRLFLFRRTAGRAILESTANCTLTVGYQNLFRNSQLLSLHSTGCVSLKVALKEAEKHKEHQKSNIRVVPFSSCRISECSKKIDVFHPSMDGWRKEEQLFVVDDRCVWKAKQRLDYRSIQYKNLFTYSFRYSTERVLSVCAKNESEKMHTFVGRQCSLFAEFGSVKWGTQSHRSQMKVTHLFLFASNVLFLCHSLLHNIWERI